MTLTFTVHKYTCYDPFLYFYRNHFIEKTTNFFFLILNYFIITIEIFLIFIVKG